MKQLRTKISLIKSFIARTPEGKAWLSEQYESLKSEQRRTYKENIL